MVINYNMLFAPTQRDAIHRLYHAITIIAEHPFELIQTTGNLTMGVLVARQDPDFTSTGSYAG